MVIDRSGSVDKESFPLEESLKLLIESFKRKYVEGITLNIFVSIVGEEDILLPTTEQNIKINKLCCKSLSLIKALKKNIEVIPEKKSVFFFSDGYFLEENIFLEIEDLKKEDVNVICFGIGEGYDEEILKIISTKNEVFEYKDIYNLI